ncbi:MAG: MATE family efflux transporter [Christensenellaceae bacterium]|jgi:Na+-driven multidrug efflux pump
MLKENLLKEKTGKLYARFCVSGVLGMIGISLYVLADTFFIANGIGQTALAALNIAIPIYSLITAVGLLFGIGCCSSYSVSKGMGDTKKAEGYFTFAVLGGAAVGLVFLLLGLFLSENIAFALGATAETIGHCKTYLQVILGFAPMFILNQVFLAFMRNIERPKAAMASMLAGSIFNIVMDYVTVYIWGWGMFGAAIATAFSPIVGMGITLPFIASKKSGLKLTRTRITGGMVKNVFAGGTSSFVVELSVGIVVLIFNMIMLRLIGNIGVAAYGIISNVSIVAYSIFTGMGQALQPIVSTNYGAAQKSRIKSTLGTAVVAALAAGIGFYLVGLFGAEWITAAFNGENSIELARITENGIRVYFIAFIPMGINVVMSYFFQSVLAMRQSLTISLMRGFVLIAVFALLLSNILGVTGVWLSALAAEAVTIVYALISAGKWFKLDIALKQEKKESRKAAEAR